MFQCPLRASRMVKTCAPFSFGSTSSSVGVVFLLLYYDHLGLSIIEVSVWLGRDRLGCSGRRIGSAGSRTLKRSTKPKLEEDG